MKTRKITGKIGTMLAVSGLAGVGVSVGAFVLSFDAIKAVAEAAHISDGISWLMPVSVDGAMTVATMAAMTLEVLGKKKLWYPAFVFVACLAISLACNALHAAKSKAVGVGDAVRHVVQLESGQAALVSAIPAVALALTLHLLIMMIQAVGDYFSEGKEAPMPTSLSEAGEPAGTMITVSPATLTDEAPWSKISGPPTPLTEPLTETVSSEPPATLTGEASSEPSDPPVSEASEPAPVNLPVPVSEPPAAPEPPAKRTPAKTSKKPTGKPRGKVAITAMDDSDLLELLATDFRDEELSANKIRIRYGIGTDKAKVIFERWKTLTDITDEALAAVGE